MRFPEAVWAEDENVSLAALHDLVEDLVGGRSADWRVQYPTFVAIPGGKAEHADVHLYKGEGEHEAVPAGLRPAPGGEEAGP